MLGQTAAQQIKDISDALNISMQQALQVYNTVKGKPQVPQPGPGGGSGPTFGETLKKYAPWIIGGALLIGGYIYWKKRRR